jgi:hypothetical protein
MTNTVRTIFLSVVGLIIPSPFAFSQGDSWTLNAGASYARFFQGSKENPHSVNTGVARVAGTVELNPNDLASSVFDLSVYPADEDWSGAISADSQPPSGYVPDPTDHMLLRFNSKSIKWAEGGELQIIGDLTLIRVVASEDSSGNMHSALMRFTTPDIEFTFPRLSAALLAGASTRQTEGEIEAFGTADVAYDAFPKLLNAITETNWPPVVENEVCTMPLVIGRDYSGAQCTGNVLAATRNDNCSMPVYSGADYDGPACAPAAGKQTAIVVHLQLLSARNEP